MFEFNDVQLCGYRQSGITESLIALAVADGLRGKKVHYVCGTVAEYREVLERIAKRANFVTVRRADGSERVEFVGGGRITFGTANSPHHLRGRYVDSIVFDNCRIQNIQWEPALTASNDPRAYYGDTIERP